MSSVVRAALRSKCSASAVAFVQRSDGFPARCFFSTEAPQSSMPPPPFLHTDDSGVTYGRMLGIRKHVLKTDIINFLEGCNLTLEDVKIDYDRGFYPLAMMLQFPTRDNYDNAIRVIVKRGRLYKLDRADRAQWDIVTPYDGKTILIRGIPRSASFEDVTRILFGYEYDASSVNMFLRPGAARGSDPIKMATVRFNSRTQAMNAFMTKNGTFCLNNRVLIQVLQ
ncbi:uncharacterized protein LOC113867756 [Abrus precatorius]|uniref:Uncharacterized protein LOC113867756 n=1 Tax=Abrus precatorius TaxID=3816 RepID=A0A8B8LRU7_ABRPR|nr:uncharacterized protein LOC113867756 [Abrus precatorius]XP_027359010.1 uncharacterized protein LOC113867756 [Abrus precatorius]